MENWKEIIKLINSWQHNSRLNGISYLTPDSVLFSHYKTQGTSGRFIKHNWNGEIIWDYNTEICNTHHDIEILDNGNILSICTEYKTIEDVQNIGYNYEIDSLFGFDMVIEIRPNNGVN